LFFAWLTEREKGNSRQPYVSKTPKIKSRKKYQHRSNLLHLRQSVSKPSAINSCIFKPLCRDKVYSSKPPKVRGVSINVRSIPRARSALVIFSF